MFTQLVHKLTHFIHSYYPVFVQCKTTD